MRVLNTLTQNLIESLTQLLKSPGEDALQALEVCAPVLIEELQQIKSNALDRREVMPQIQSALNEWLQRHPQQEETVKDLLAALERQKLLAKTSKATEEPKT
ncbi:hypothetical protein H7A76_26845 [Pseudomonas sp. MSSRFD41]|uniref:hypothetical protein n=1 Tax=Pseudomonas sp. MSSRFD41 TaxID=1310370 RepID=UPI00163A6373|nr:hypothetical protein [Pseudomonas sp. MSSRFD41]MBC2659072.1 hypothetical protein [Pseudomonas sp. MSSRFD41]